MTEAALPLSFAEALQRWHDFYGLLGAAAATMVALLFVAASVGAGVFMGGQPTGLRFFLSATVVNFATILVASLVALAPLDAWATFGTMITLCGLVGLGYYGLAWGDSAREGILAKVDLEDRLWFGIFPVVGHLVETGAGFMLALRAPWGLEALALALGLLLIVGVHNAWDITIWVVGKKIG